MSIEIKLSVQAELAGGRGASRPRARGWRLQGPVAWRDGEIRMLSN